VPIAVSKSTSRAKALKQAEQKLRKDAAKNGYTLGRIILRGDIQLGKDLFRVVLAASVRPNPKAPASVKKRKK
jgi:hypothetical protein